MKFSSQIKPISYLKSHTAEVVRAFETDRTPLIITQNGEVTLKGPVRTEQEKESIESKAVGIAGSGHVTNQLEVAPKQ